jgi:hypothetical protein
LDIPVKPDQFTLYRTSSTENSVEIGSVTTNTITLPASSISTLVGFGPSGPAIDEIANRFLNAGDAALVEIPLTGISNGNGGDLEITAESSDPNFVSNIEVVYTSPDPTGVLRFNVNSTTAAKATVTLHLINENATSPTDFSFNSTQASFNVEVVNAVTAVKKNESSVSLRIYPNPSRAGSLEIELEPVAARRKLTVLDVWGNEIATAPVESGIHHITLNSQHWETGMYYIQVSGNRSLSGKVITIK